MKKKLTATFFSGRTALHTSSISDIELVDNVLKFIYYREDGSTYLKAMAYTLKPETMDNIYQSLMKAIENSEGKSLQINIVLTDDSKVTIEIPDIGFKRTAGCSYIKDEDIGESVPVSKDKPEEIHIVKEKKMADKQEQISLKEYILRDDESDLEFVILTFNKLIEQFKKSIEYAKNNNTITKEDKEYLLQVTKDTLDKIPTNG